MNTANTYVPTFVPQDVKWYERDGLMNWYDQRKCRDFLDELTNGLGVKICVNLVYRIIKQFKKRGF